MNSKIEVAISPTPELKDFIASTVSDAVTKAVKPFIENKPPEFVTRQEYASMLGISLGSVDNAIKRGEIIPKRIGKRVLISIDQ